MAQSDNKGRNTFNTLLIAVIGQMGCLALIIIVLSVLGGLWLDNTFHTKPVFTLVLLLAGIPISVISMLYVARKTLERLNLKNEATHNEESN